MLEADFEIFKNGATDAAREVLRIHNMLHYFCPAADQIVLAAAERSAPTPLALALALAMWQVALASEAGHPLAPNEIVDPRTDLIDLLEALRDKGLVTEGSTVVELTPAGHSVRAEVKFKPREDLMAKLARVLSKDRYEPHGHLQRVIKRRPYSIGGISQTLTSARHGVPRSSKRSALAYDLDSGNAFNSSLTTASRPGACLTEMS